MKDPRKGHPPRLPGYDYSSEGAYFVTFTVADRACCLGTVDCDQVVLTRAGQAVHDSWNQLPHLFDNIDLDYFIVMPNHVHAVLFLRSGLDESRPHTGPPDPVWPMMADRKIVLGKVVRAWKAQSTRSVRAVTDPAFRWQSRYYDRVIRDERELERVREYIRLNPACWADDQDNPARVWRPGQNSMPGLRR